MSYFIQLDGEPLSGGVLYSDFETARAEMLRLIREWDHFDDPAGLVDYRFNTRRMSVIYWNEG